MNEIIIYMNLAALTLLVNAISAPDDEHKRKNMYMTNYLLNQFNRVSTDITTYTSPMSFKQISGNIIPAMSAVQDGAYWVAATVKLIEGEDKLKAGIYAGESRWIRATEKLFPLTTQIPRTIAQTKQLMGEGVAGH
jgi:hypothetical protein